MHHIVHVLVKHQKTGKIIEDCLEDITLQELKRAKVIFLELPRWFLTFHQVNHLYNPTDIVLCKCTVNKLLVFQAAPGDLQGILIVTPIPMPTITLEELGPELFISRDPITQLPVFICLAGMFRLINSLTEYEANIFGFKTIPEVDPTRADLLFTTVAILEHLDQTNYETTGNNGGILIWEKIE